MEHYVRTAVEHSASSMLLDAPRSSDQLRLFVTYPKRHLQRTSNVARASVAFAIFVALPG